MTWVVQAPGREWTGYERRLFSRVRQALWDYEPLRASHAQIVITIHGSEVHLNGRVRTLPQKIMAELLARRVEDVSGVVNELVADPEVTRSLADALSADARTAPYVLRVETRHGVAVLRGEVPTREVQRLAIDIASATPLVGAVRDALAVGVEPWSSKATSRNSDTGPEKSGLSA